MPNHLRSKLKGTSRIDITMPKEILIPTDIRQKIYTIRGLQVMLDEDLAKLYMTSTMRLNQTVKRNRSRFPDQFCFQLTKIEYANLISQFVISSLRSQIATSSYGGRRKLPYAFAEQGVAMLAGVLKSKVAVRVSIQIMTEFVAMRKIIQANSQMFTRLDIVEQKQLAADKKFDQLFTALAGSDEFPKQKLYFDGQIFDAHLFVSKLIRAAKKSIILIDNFVDETVLNLLTKRKEGVSVTIYCKRINNSLVLDLEKHNSQYPPIKIKEFSQSHDRFLIIDKISIHHFGASIKDLGKKWCAVTKLQIDSLEMLLRLQ